MGSTWGEYYQSCPCSITNIDTSSTMQYILLLKISSIFALNFKEAPVNRDLIDMTEEEFLDFFELPDIEDQEENGRRKKALKQHQDEVKEIHEKFANGESDWDAGIYEFSDLPDEDFVTTHTGLLGNIATTTTTTSSPKQKDKDLYPSYRIARSAQTRWDKNLCFDYHKKICEFKKNYYGCKHSDVANSCPKICRLC